MNEKVEGAELMSRAKSADAAEEVPFGQLEELDGEMFHDVDENQLIVSPTISQITPPTPV